MTLKILTRRPPYSTDSGIVDSSLPAADEEHTPENEPTLAEQFANGE